MPNSEKVSRPIGKNSTDNAQTTYEWKTLYRRDLAKAQFSEKINQFICKVENFVYLCIGKRAVQGTKDILKPHICGVLWAVPIFGTVRFPKHNESLALFVHTCK